MNMVRYSELKHPAWRHVAILLVEGTGRVSQVLGAPIAARHSNLFREPHAPTAPLQADSAGRRAIPQGWSRPVPQLDASSL